MKLAIWLCVGALASSEVCASTIPDTAIPEKFSPRAPAVLPESRLVPPQGGGDTFATATEITSLPFTDSGTTCGFKDDYFVSCAYPWQPDVVYRYAPSSDVCVDVSLCGSTFDTALAIYASGPDSVVCNNDACGLASRISHRALHAGETYYFVIDGAGYSCGNYQFSVTPCCDVPCPAGAVAENEVCCLDPQGTCPQTAIPIDCGPLGVTYCGTYGAAGGIRDTDWYQIQVTEPSVLHMGVTAESPTLIGILTGKDVFTEVCAHYSTVSCSPKTCDAAVAPGTYYFYVAPTDFDGIPCGTRYTLFASCAPSGVTNASVLHGNDANGVPLLAGQQVTVVGCVTGQWPMGAGSRFTLQDLTGGISVLGAPEFCGWLSDQVLVLGVVGQSNGWTVLVPPLTIRDVNPAGVTQPIPVDQTVDQLLAAYHVDSTEPLESSLIRVLSVGIRHADGSDIPPGETFAAGAVYQIVSTKSGGTIPLRVLADANGCGISSPLVGTVIPSHCTLDVTGVLAQFDATAGHRQGYAIAPRFPADFTKHCATPTLAVTWGSLKARYR